MSGRPPREPPALSRDRLVLAAIDVIAEHGVAGATVARIGERAGMSRAAAGFHFGSQVRLFQAATEDLAHRPTLPIPGVGDEPTSTPDTIRWIASSYVALATLDPAATRALTALTLAAASGMTSLRPALLDRNVRMRAVLAAFLSRLQARGEIAAAIDVGAVAAGLWTALEGLRFSQDEAVDDGMLAAAVNELAESFAQRLCPPVPDITPLQ